MSRLIKCLCIPAVAVAFLAVADAPKADAVGFGIRVGGIGVHTVHRHHVGFRPVVRTVRPAVIYGGGFRTIHVGRPAYFHNTTHVDYHPPQLVPHHGHLDYVPGHYQVHRTGHWHH